MRVTIHCACGAVVPVEDLSLDRLLARCRACNQVFSFADQLGAPTDPALAIPRPRAITRREAGGVLTLTRRWFHPEYLPLSVITLALLGFLAYVLPTFADASRMARIAFGLFTVAGGIMTWSALRGLNRTTLRLDAEALTVDTAPVPPRQRRRIASGAIESLWVQPVPPERRRHRPDLRPGRFELWARLTGQRHIRLAAGFTDEAEALYVEQELKAALGLATKPEPGAVVAPPGLRRPVGVEVGQLGLARPDAEGGGLSEP